MPDIAPAYTYRLDFPLASKPVERRKIELMQKILLVDKELKRMKFKGSRGWHQIVCFAPYTNAGQCLATTSGETEWLPQAIQEMKKYVPSTVNDYKTKKSYYDSHLEEIGLTKTEINELSPEDKVKRLKKYWDDHKDWREKIFVSKVFIPTFKPTTKTLTEEIDWWESIQSIRGKSDVLTREEAEEKRDKAFKDLATEIDEVIKKREEEKKGE